MSLAPNRLFGLAVRLCCLGFFWGSGVALPASLPSLVRLQCRYRGAMMRISISEWTIPKIHVKSRIALQLYCPSMISLSYVYMWLYCCVMRIKSLAWWLMLKRWTVVHVFPLGVWAEIKYGCYQVLIVWSGGVWWILSPLTSAFP